MESRREKGALAISNCTAGGGRAINMKAEIGMKRRRAKQEIQTLAK